jgi:UDP-2,4-diacetamido-2,4,6-trideoxy-beta-L-altropyranose hydrolase
LRVSLRKAQPKDCRRLWIWRNDAEVRNNSFSSQKVPYAQHKVWFQKKLTERIAMIFIGMLSGQPFGMIRLEFGSGGRTALVHVSVKSSARGRGLGAVLLEGGCQKALRKGVRKIEAFVLAANKASLRVFEKSSFKRIKKLKKNGRTAYFMTRTCVKQKK